MIRVNAIPEIRQHTSVTGLFSSKLITRYTFEGYLVDFIIDL